MRSDTTSKLLGVIGSARGAGGLTLAQIIDRSGLGRSTVIPGLRQLISSREVERIPGSWPYRHRLPVEAPAVAVKPRDRMPADKALAEWNGLELVKRSRGVITEGSAKRETLLKSFRHIEKLAGSIADKLDEIGDAPDWWELLSSGDTPTEKSS